MTSTCTAVDSLPVALRLVSHAHQAAVLSHPAWTDIAEEADPARQLAWMVEQYLLSYDELDDLQTFEQQPCERDRIVEEAFAILGQGNTVANGRLLDQMLADRLITPVQHARVHAMPLDEPCDSAASMLFSMVLKGIMSSDEFTSLYEQVLAERGSGMGGARWETVLAAYGAMKKYEALLRTAHSALHSEQRQLNLRFGLCLAGAALMTWFIVAHWPG